MLPNVTNKLHVGNISESIWKLFVCTRSGKERHQNRGIFSIFALQQKFGKFYEYILGKNAT